MDIVDLVNGKTTSFMLFGRPVFHSFSPVLQNTIAKALNVNTIYTAVNVDNLEAAVKGAYAMRIKGINVTVPYKEEVMPLLCGIDKKAEAIGAVNTLKYTENGYYGYNTDIIGLTMSLKLQGIDIKGKTVVVLGAGGAARAAVTMALTEGAAKTYIVNRTRKNAEAIRDNVLKYYDGEVYVCGYSQLDDIEGELIIIQTTSVGMGEGVYESPIKDNKIFERTAALVDIIYNPMETKIMADAWIYGVPTANGLDMLIYQGIASFEIWTGFKIDDKTKLKIRDRLRLYYEREKK